MTRRSTLSALCGCTLMAASTALAGPEWPEMGDAGRLPNDAQIPNGFGELQKISGELEGLSPAGPGDFQDMYRIYIKFPSMFSASTNPTLGGAASFDTQLWLFAADGTGLLANDEEFVGSGFSTLLSASNDGSGAAVLTEGFYFLAISGADSDPVSVTDLPIFLQADRTEISGPDGPGGSDMIGDWAPPMGATGTYEIALTGVMFTPTPGALALLVLGASGRTRRRR